MFRLKDTARTPHFGWVYKVKETSVELEADTYYQLVDKVASHLAMNGFKNTRASIEADIQNYIVLRASDGFGVGYKQKRVFSVEKILTATAALYSKPCPGGSRYVPQLQAEQRAHICSGCPANLPLDSSLYDFSSDINKAKRGRVTAIDDELHVCIESQCFISPMVHYDASVLLQITGQYRIEGYPDHCWKKKEIKAALEASK